MPKPLEPLRARLRPRQRLLEREDARLDRTLGIVTSGEAEPADLTVPTGEVETGFSYVATPVRLARWWLDALPRDHGEFTFIDMGSGKGRVLAQAAQHGFGRVVGVEFAEELHDAAVVNARAAGRHGVVFEPRLGDAAAFEFPPGPLVVHFNNPFAEAVMERVIGNLSRAYERGAPRVVIVYQQRALEDPEHATSNLELLASVPFLEARKLEPTGWIDRWLLGEFDVRIFETTAAAAPAS